MSELDPRRLRRVMGLGIWGVPRRFGPDGWVMDHLFQRSRVIVSKSTISNGDDTEWTHASMSHRDSVPTYEEMCQLHLAVWGGTGWAYHLFAPRKDHININANVLHLWGRADGKEVLPNFGGILGSI